MGLVQALLVSFFFGVLGILADADHIPEYIWGKWKWLSRATHIPLCVSCWVWWGVVSALLAGWVVAR